MDVAETRTLRIGCVVTRKEQLVIGVTLKTTNYLTVGVAQDRETHPSQILTPLKCKSYERRTSRRKGMKKKEEGGEKEKNFSFKSVNSTGYGSSQFKNYE